MKMIRKKLDAAELDPPFQRYNNDTGEFQRSNDGGVTWIDDPLVDPRVNPGYLLPPASPSDTARCNGAYRMVLAWQDALTQLNGTVSAGEFALTMLGLLAALAGGVGLLADIFVAGFEAILTIGLSDVNAAFTSTLWDEIQCIFYCDISEDGSISENQLAKVIADIAAAHPGDAVINGAVNIFNSFYGAVLLSNASVERTDTGDCSGCTTCEWSVCIDLGWAWGVGVYFPSPGFNCAQSMHNYNANQGVLATLAGLPAWECTKNLGDTANRLGYSFGIPVADGSTLTSVSIWFANPGSGGFTNLVFYIDLPTLVSGQAACEDGFYTNPFVFSSFTPVPGIDSVPIQIGIGTSQASDSRSIYVAQILIAGTGAPPLIPTVAQTYF